MPAKKVETESGAAHSKALNRAADVGMEVSVEIGRTRLSVDTLLNMTEGSLIEVDKISGEPVDVRANGELFARGEVIVISENFGVRLTEIVSQET